MLKRESSALVFSFLRFFCFVDLFHFFVLARVAVSQKASTEADVMSETEIDGVLKYTPDKIGTRDRGKIYMAKINKTVYFNNCDATVLSFLIILSKPVRMRLKSSETLTSSISLILKDIFMYLILL